jgi:6-phosphogluconate dehydrogenase (decarboxylating)
MKIAFIGLGITGARLATALTSTDDVTVFTRSPDKTRALASAGAPRATSVAVVVTAPLIQYNRARMENADYNPGLFPQTDAQGPADGE